MLEYNKDRNKRKEITMNTARKSHQRKVYECYIAIRDGKSFAQFGKKTRDEAFKMYKEEKAKELGMTME